MRRIELINSIEEVIKAIEESKIKEAIETALESPRQERSLSNAVEVLAALKEYSIRARVFSPAAKEFANIFELHILEQPDLWAKLVLTDERTYLGYVFRAIRFATEFLPKMIPLIQQESIQLIKQSSTDSNYRYKGKGILSVIVFEQNDKFSNPLRLVNILESINLFYETCALMHDLSPQELSVLACDSGSDKSFDFLGAAKVIECIKELILSLWDRVIFFREHQFEERLELIAKSLPIISKISELENENKIGPEQAEIYRRNIFEGANKFIQSGATIPEIDNTHHDVRRLMSPVQKLLTSALNESSSEEGSSKETTEANRPNIDKLSADERAEFFRLLEKTRRDNTDSQKSTDEPEQ